MKLDDTGAGSRPRHWMALAAALLATACLDGENPAPTVDSAEPGADFGADPAHLRAGPPRLRLGSVSGEGQTDFHDIAGVVVDRAGGVLVVANRGDATLRTFALDGEWRGTWGGAGGGPRELGELTALFRYRGDSVVVYDGERGAASVWPYAGGEVRRVWMPIPPGDTLQSARLQGAM
ncbi:hypothetical protein, partial [Candidatus Palauibacter polyketidifaciens]|uniref:hypothetical protein n=1 Tax=Candidatus Palauibacter polyketidifaciens TaxID=3056740 RepID=UPI00239DBBD4